MIRLGVNIDHVATVRQARRAKEPDPVAAAVACQLGGVAPTWTAIRPRARIALAPSRTGDVTLLRRDRDAAS